MSSIGEKEMSSILARHDPCVLPVSRAATGAFKPSITLSRSILSHLDIIASDYGSSYANILQLAWALVLRCYLDTDSVCFGYQYLEHCVTDLQSKSFDTIFSSVDGEDFISSVLHTWNESASHKVDQLLLASTGQALIYNTALVLSKDDKCLGSVRRIDQQLSLVVHCEIAGGQAQTTILYNEITISSQRAEHLVYSFETAVAAILLQSFTKIGDLSLFNVRDHQKVARENTRILESSVACVTQLFKGVVAISPGSTALCSWEGVLTYQELDTYSTSLAYQLRKHGVRPETIVPLCFEKSIWAIVSILAVVKAGGAFLCLDPKHPVARQTQILAEAQAGAKVSIVLFSEANSLCPTPELVSLRQLLSTSLELPLVVVSAKTLSLRSVSLGEQQANHSSPESQNFAEADLNHAAYVVFTSGSTGTPKGIVVEHRALSTSVQAQAHAMQINTDSRVLQYAAYTFDVSIGDIFAVLTHGGCLCIPSEEERRDSLAATIGHLRVNQACLTSTVASLLTPIHVPTLRKLTLGGELASKQDLLTWAEHVTLSNVYGPAECTIWSFIRQKVAWDDNEANIGHGIGAHGWIVDAKDHDKLVPVGAIGELLVEGPLLARGYLNDASKTEAAFIVDPQWTRLFGLRKERRFYKTGDLVRYGDDGDLLFVGRKDSQIKLRGQRIELGEIEHHLKTYLGPSISLAVEIATPSGSDDPVIVAFICLADADDGKFVAFVEKAKQLLPKILPQYMVPKIFLPMDSLPVTTSGKTDRKSLRNICSSKTHAELSALIHPNHEVIPHDVNESRMAPLWAKILGIKTSQIRPSDNFFTLGADSFGAMRLVAAAREEGIALTVAQIFKTPQLSNMASLAAVSPSVSAMETTRPFQLLDGLIDSEALLTEAAHQCQIDRNCIEEVLPVTALQSDMMLHSLTGDKSQFAQEVVQLSQHIDILRFKGAWEQIVQLHPILRTRLIRSHKGSLWQVVLKESINWHIPTDIPAYLATGLATKVTVGSALVSWAMCQDENAPSTELFIIRMHHSLFDGVSLALIFRDVFSAYHGIALPSDPPLFSSFLAYTIRNKQPDSDLYWTNYLHNCSASVFPALPYSDYRPHPLGSFQTYLPMSNTSELQSYGLTISTLVRGAYSLLLSRRTRSLDVIFGAFLAGRSAPVPKIEELAAPTFCLVPLRVLLSLEQPTHVFLATLQEQATNMIPFEQDGMACISHAAPVMAEICGQIQNLLVVQPMPPSAPMLTETDQFPGRILSGPHVEPGPMAEFNWFGLMMECTIMKDGIAFRTSFDELLISTSEVEELVREFGLLLELMVDNLGQALQVPSSLSL